MVRAFGVTLFVSALVPLVGCGPKLQDVTGSVSLDGKPVADASVSFFATDGTVYGGGSDASGNFTIPAVRSGEYKAVVAKYPKSTGSAPGEDGKADKAYLETMKKNMAKSPAGGMTTPMPGKAGMPMMPPSLTGGGTGAKSELPEVYSSIAKTTLTVKVPTDGPVQLQLKSK